MRFETPADTWDIYIRDVDQEFGGFYIGGFRDRNEAVEYLKILRDGSSDHYTYYLVKVTHTVEDV